MEITSSAFAKNDYIPEKYGCDKEGNNPPLCISDVPEDSQSLVIIGEDPDTDGNWLFWLVWNIEPNVEKINEGEVPPRAVEGLNSWGRIGYGAICPTHLMNVHRYIFWLFALDNKLDLPPGSSKAELKNAMKGHILERAHLTGIFRR